jgi:hypothetical protein
MSHDGGIYFACAFFFNDCLAADDGEEYAD